MKFTKFELQLKNFSFLEVGDGQNLCIMKDLWANWDFATWNFHHIIKFFWRYIKKKLIIKIHLWRKFFEFSIVKEKMTSQPGFWWKCLMALSTRNLNEKCVELCWSASNSIFCLICHRNAKMKKIICFDVFFFSRTELSNFRYRANLIEIFLLPSWKISHVISIICNAGARNGWTREIVSLSHVSHYPGLPDWTCIITKTMKFNSWSIFDGGCIVVRVLDRCNA